MDDMPEAPLEGKLIVLVIEDEFEDADLAGAREALAQAGARVLLVGPVAGRAYVGRHGERIVADAAPADLKDTPVHAVFVPGGHAADRLRLRHAVVDLVRHAASTGVPIAAIGHGPQLLISANAVRGRTLTCWPSIAVDVKNAGGRYVDRPVVEDGGLITSRKTADLPQLLRTLVAALTR